MQQGLYYDEEDDHIVFFSSSNNADSKIRVDRETVLRELADMVNDFGDDFAIFRDEQLEPTELVFLQPPTRDCLGGDEE